MRKLEEDLEEPSYEDEESKTDYQDNLSKQVSTQNVEEPIILKKQFSYFKPSTWKFRKGGKKSKKRKQKRTKKRRH